MISNRTDKSAPEGSLIQNIAKRHGEVQTTFISSLAMTPVLERSLIQTTFIGSKKTQEAVHAMFELVSTLIFKKYPRH